MILPRFKLPRGLNDAEMAANNDQRIKVRVAAKNKRRILLHDLPEIILLGISENYSQFFRIYYYSIKSKNI